jgi:hypothetical protein
MTTQDRQSQPVEIEEVGLAVKEQAVPTPAQPRDAAYWAPKVDRLEVDAAHAAMGFNIAGKRLTGPQQGFGKLWQRSYSASLPLTVSPDRLIAEWKANFGSFWPKGNRFGAELIAPGEVAPIAMKAGAGVKLSTGVLVLYADPESFTFMTPEGHMFAAWITFSGHVENDTTVMRIQILLRTSDPLFELAWPAMRFMEDKFWRQTMRNVAAHLGVGDIVIEEKTVCVDKKRQWKNWSNVRHNMAIRSVLHMLAAPFRRLRRSDRSDRKAH